MARALISSNTAADNAAGSSDFAWFAEVGLDARGGLIGICRQLEPKQRRNITQAICRIRVPVTVIWFRLSLER
jgi:hypothetical protein